MSNFEQGKGHKREQIPWYPTVDEKKCAGCRKCFEFCKHGVYAWDNVRNKVSVLTPFECVVGCSTCAGLCPGKAIVFPPLSILKPFLI